jgi:DNA replication protein DnaC
MERLHLRAVTEDPLVVEELAEVNKARRTVWTADLRAMVAQDIGQRALVWQNALCRQPQAMRQAFSKCVGGTGIVIEGAIGTGKTTMAVHLLLGLAAQEAITMQRHGFDLPEPEAFAYATRSADLFRSLGARYGEAKERGNAILARARAVRYLLVDDVGREAEDPDSFAAFQSLIDYRYSQERPVIIATNMTSAEYAAASIDANGQTIPAGPKVHWAAIISRWHQVASWISLDGDDLRKR